MPSSEILRRSVEAGREATAQASERVEALVSEIVRISEQQADTAQRVVEELSERSDRFRDALEEVVRARVADVGLATQDDIRRLEAEIRKLERSATKATKKKATKKKAAKKKAAKKKAAGS